MSKDTIKITLREKALEKFFWIKTEGEFETIVETVDFVFNTAIEFLKKTANGKSVTFKRIKQKDLVGKEKA